MIAGVGSVATCSQASAGLCCRLTRPLARFGLPERSSATGSLLPVFIGSPV